MRRYTAIFCILLAGCGDFLSGPSQLETLRRNQVRWSSLQVRDYDFDYQKTCFCAPLATQPVRIEVRAGNISRVVSLVDGQTVVAQLIWPTIDSLFVWTERALDGEYNITISYDPINHFPTRVSGDIPRVADEEFVHTSSNFVRK